jgi:hypothetical protein
LVFPSPCKKSFVEIHPGKFRKSSALQKTRPIIKYCLEQIPSQLAFSPKAKASQSGMIYSYPGSIDCRSWRQAQIQYFTKTLGSILFSFILQQDKNI